MTTPDFDALAAWAESDDAAEALTDSPSLYGDEAAEESHKVLSRVGRPSLDNEHASHAGRSPRRQVRLSADLNERLDSYTATHGGNASAVIREAVEEFLDSVGA